MTRIFVFGSNLAGRHGKGAALFARKYHGAIYGQAEGLQGQAYAIPTKGHDLKPLPLGEIAEHVKTFLRFAEVHADLTFHVTPIGCGLAGYKPHQIAPMFALVSNNVLLPPEFEWPTRGDEPHANEGLMKSTTLLPRHGCPVCLQAVDAATDMAGDARPNPGDLTICAYCASVLEFDDELRPHQASASTLAEIDTQTSRKIEVLRQAIQQLRTKKQEGTPT